MTALLRHRPAVRGGLRLTVQPNDGRMIEHYLVDAAELRRFAWAVLADLAPDEAQAAAAEEGVDLAECRKVRPLGIPLGSRMVDRRVSSPGARLARDGDHHHALAAMVREGPQRSAAWKGRFQRQGSPGLIFCELVKKGLAYRQDDRLGESRVAVYAHTDAGALALDVIERAQEAA